jgi:hypothetical protein
LAEQKRVVLDAGGRMIIKKDFVLFFVLGAGHLFLSCSEKQPTKPQPLAGVLRGQVTEPNTRPIAGARINLGYNLGPSVMSTGHRVKKPAPGYDLIQNYPNPYNEETRFQFKLANSSRVVFKVLPRIYDQNVIVTLLDKTLKPGIYSVIWNSLLPDSTLLTNGSYLYRLQALEDSVVIFEDEFYLFHNYPDTGVVARMKPMTTTDVNGYFSISHQSTSIGDTVTVTDETMPDPREVRVISDSIMIFVSRVGYKTAMRRVQFREQDVTQVNLTLENQ